MTGRVTYPCWVCGEQTTNRKRKGRHQCTDCGVTAAIDSARQLAAKSGPYWDRYVESVRKFIDMPRGSRQIR